MRSAAYHDRSASGGSDFRAPHRWLCAFPRGENPPPDAWHKSEAYRKRYLRRLEVQRDRLKRARNNGRQGS